MTLLPTDLADAARRALSICDRIGDPRSELAAIHAAGLSVTEIGATELDRLIDEYRTGISAPSMGVRRE